MQKLLLKLAYFEYLERLLRFESLLAEVMLASDNTADSLLHWLDGECRQLKLKVQREHSFFQKLFSEKPLREREKDPHYQFQQQVEQALFHPYHTLTTLTDWLLQVARFSIPPELRYFLREITLAELVAHPAGVLSPAKSSTLKASSVLFCTESIGPSFRSPSHLNSLPDVYLEYLPLLQKNNPLGWSGLIRGFAEQMAEQAIMALYDQPRKNGFDVSQKELACLSGHLISLRLMGPAYYYATLIEAFLWQDALFFQRIEPALFYGVNHANFMDKSLVMLHESAERAPDLLMPDRSPNRSEIENPVSPPLPQDTLLDLLRIIEKMIPARYTFTEKCFKRALSLQGRLDGKILLSGIQRYPLSDIADKLNEFQQTPDSHPEAVYQVLAMSAELPNTPREIVNAGWLHKTGHAASWLYATVCEPKESNEAPGNPARNATDRFADLKAMLEERDQLLIKSIETSEIHRVLLCTA